LAVGGALVGVRAGDGGAAERACLGGYKSAGAEVEREDGKIHMKWWMMGSG